MTFETFKKTVDGSGIGNVGFASTEFSSDIFHSVATMTDKPLFIWVARSEHLNMKIRYTPYSALVSFSRSEKEFFLMEDYAATKKIMTNEEYAKTFSRQDSESEEQYLQRILNFTIAFVLRHLKDLADGAAWEYIPYDWKGYK